MVLSLPDTLYPLLLEANSGYFTVRFVTVVAELREFDVTPIRPERLLCHTFRRKVETSRFLSIRVSARQANCTVTPDNQNVMRFRVLQTTVPFYTVSTAARYLVM